MADDKFRERKFILSMLFTLTGCAGLFFGYILSEHFYWLAGAVLGGYGFNKWAEKPEDK